MFKIAHQTSSVAVCLVLFLFGIAVSQPSASSPPLTYNEILSLLSKKVDGKEICKQIKAVKVSFSLSTQTTATLVKSGASDTLLTCIESNPSNDKSLREELSITSPQKGEEIGTDLQVKGMVKPIPGKHLWLFAQRRGLSKWWPQSGEIIIEDNGEWVQGAFLGQPRDKGFEFVIKAIWLDEATHQQVTQTLSTWEAQQNWPGMVLPQGSPAASVVVKKTRD